MDLVESANNSSANVTLFINNNNSDNNNNDTWLIDSSTSDLWYRYDFWTAAIMCIAYGTVFIIGLLGNLMVTVGVLSGSRTMRRSVTNVFLVNLAIADLLVVIACVPFTLVAHLIYPWVMGPIICKLLPFTQGVSVCASVYTLVAVAVERYRSISSPWTGRLSRSTCQWIIAIIWLGAALITLPWLVVFRQDWINNSMPICTEDWPNPVHGDIYFVIAHLSLCYVGPLIIIVMCYAMICKKIWCRKIPGCPMDERSSTPPTLTISDRAAAAAENNKTGGNSSKDLNRTSREISSSGRGTLNLQRAKMRALRMLAVVVAVFALSWLPFYAAFTRFKLARDMSAHEAEFWEVTIPFAQWLGSANSCVNPLLYHFLDARFRVRFRQLLRHRPNASALGRFRFRVPTSRFSGQQNNNVARQHEDHWV